MLHCNCNSLFDQIDEIVHPGNNFVASFEVDIHCLSVSLIQTVLQQKYDFEQNAKIVIQIKLL